MYLYFVRPQLVPKPWGKESPPRQKTKAGTDPDVPRMRYTDDTFHGNFSAACLVAQSSSYVDC